MSELTAEYVSKTIGELQFGKVQTAIAMAKREIARPVGHRTNASKLTIEQAISKIHGIRKGYNVEVPKGQMTLGTAGLIDFISKSYHIIWVKSAPMNKHEKASLL